MDLCAAAIQKKTKRTSVMADTFPQRFLGKVGSVKREDGRGHGRIYSRLHGLGPFLVLPPFSGEDRF